jgi:hypothetical protein
LAYKVGGHIFSQIKKKDMRAKTNIKNMYYFTKSKDHSKLYLTIDSMIETLRSKGFEDKDIKKGLMYFVEEIIDEQ